MYQIIVEARFHAAHAIRLPDGQVEPSHAHDWHVEVTVGCEQLDQAELVMDFHELQSIVNRALDDLHEADLNQLAAFASWNSTAERVAELIYQRIAGQLPDRVMLISVSVTEAPGCRAVFVGG